ncbi:hypothetical protein MPTK1_5g05390 [Marchantia polymorpha subsp. ruderalis]|uniref:FAS1 domain-containing protein n=2 Tax=Marchantia polymorpha TaxID=3197 RepID=A0AAF6BF75_MARPO|nr:hypothetical protein MARPO_0027s0087 [Marchantia polymorpha]BBN10659.1 hypothetical protein Mp_5g05390 [Marchantia polymorpha subsp. ruderalis]|eukprot:PTQ42975.1 hypothetical protein MARPO_0027s0087 [Marchantia polymorpha]
MGPRRAARSGLMALALLCCIVGTCSQSTHKFNITKMLSGHPRFSVFREMLSSHGVAAEINGRKSVTLLAPANNVMRAFRTSNNKTDAIKITDLLRFHVLLTYFDMAELRALKTTNYTSVTTLLQTTGRASGNNGFVNIYNLKSRVKLGPSVPDSSSNVTVLAGVQKSPFDVSIIEIDQVLLPVGFNNASGDLIAVLDSFQEFTLLISYLQETKVDAVFAEKQAEGITIFAPRDSAFNSLATGSIQTLSLSEQKLLLEYHALDGYESLDSLETMLNKPTKTLASADAAGYILNVSATPGQSTVRLRTGVSVATVLEIIYDANPVTMYAIDEVLLPLNLFTPAPLASPAPAPAPKKSAVKSPPAHKVPATVTPDSASLAERSLLVTMAALISSTLAVIL